MYIMSYDWVLKLAPNFNGWLKKMWHAAGTSSFLFANNRTCLQTIYQKKKELAYKHGFFLLFSLDRVCFVYKTS